MKYPLRIGKTTPTHVAKQIIAALKQMENDGKELRAVIEYNEDLILEVYREIQFYYKNFRI